MAAIDAPSMQNVANAKGTLGKKKKEKKKNTLEIRFQQAAGVTLLVTGMAVLNALVNLHGTFWNQVVGEPSRRSLDLNVVGARRRRHTSPSTQRIRRERNGIRTDALRAQKLEPNGILVLARFWELWRKHPKNREGTKNDRWLRSPKEKTNLDKSKR